MSKSPQSLSPSSSVWLLTAALGLNGLAAPGAFAQPAQAGALDQLLTQYGTVARTWVGAINGAAQTLFWLLVAITVVWSGLTLIMRKASIAEFAGEIIRLFLFAGFFLWLLQEGPAFAGSILKGLTGLGGTASAVPVTSPSGIIDAAFTLWKRAFLADALNHPADSLFRYALAAIVFVCLALVALNLVLLQVAGWVVMYAGIFFLGFGGSRWTSGIAIRYFKTVLNIGLQILVMALLVGVGLGFFQQVSADTGAQSSTITYEAWSMLLIAALALVVLCNKLPAFVGDASQGHVGTHGIGSFGARDLVGAAVTAIGLVSGSYALIVATRAARAVAKE